MLVDDQPPGRAKEAGRYEISGFLWAVGDSVRFPEAALVTAGAASALTLGTAACMTITNKSAIHNIPTDLTDIKNEVVVQKAHRYGYDHAMRNCGIRFVEVETLEDYEKAFNERTVMTNFFNAPEEGKISREDWIRVAHKHGVACFNDAAADVPPISNLWNYTQMGFDMVAFSGGNLDSTIDISDLELGEYTLGGGDFNAPSISEHGFGGRDRNTSVFQFKRIAFVLN